jgi:hypothetical protein
MKRPNFILVKVLNYFYKKVHFIKVFYKKIVFLYRKSFKCNIIFQHTHIFNKNGQKYIKNSWLVCGYLTSSIFNIYHLALWLKILKNDQNLTFFNRA